MAWEPSTWWGSCRSNWPFFPAVETEGAEPSSHFRPHPEEKEPSLKTTALCCNISLEFLGKKWKKVSRKLEETRKNQNIFEVFFLNFHSRSFLLFSGKMHPHHSLNKCSTFIVLNVHFKQLKKPINLEAKWELVHFYSKDQCTQKKFC